MRIFAPRYNKESVLRKLQEVTSGRDGAFEQRLGGIFTLGREVLGLKIGILARIEGSDYEVVGVSCPPDAELSTGMHFDVRDTYCCKVLEADEPIGFAEAHGGQWADHPCYDKFGLESYLGAPIRVNGSVYGTLNFSADAPRDTEFTGFEVELIRLMARWLGGELERLEAARALERDNRMLRMIVDCQSGLLRSEDRAATFDKWLRGVLEFTDSEYGFLGELVEDGNGALCLQRRALCNLAGAEASSLVDRDDPASTAQEPALTSAGTRALSEVRIANDPTSDPMSFGFPKGHPPLSCFAVLPVFWGGVQSGLLGIANRTGGYHADLSIALEPLLDACGHAIAHSRTWAKRPGSSKGLPGALDS